MSLAVAAPSRPATERAPRPACLAAPPRRRGPGWVAPALVVALAGVLRGAGLGGMRDNSFYDAAVRSMGSSWHAFVTGAIDPSATVSVDKPPVDLWLQVASTRLLGFGSVGLHLPEALGGTLAVLALYHLLRVLFGRSAALAGALALALLPIAVITSRSDTMDSLMAALVIAAAALAARAARDDRPMLLVGAGAVLGLAFEVKLFEALVAAPALVLLWVLGSSLPGRARAIALGGAGAAFIVVALAWLIALPVLAGPQRPWAFGSTNGSAWNATFVYDGIDRVTGFPRQALPVVPPAAQRQSTVATRRQLALRADERASSLRGQPAGPSPWRLFAAADHVMARVGLELGLALLALAAALLARAGRDLDRLGRAGAWALLTWLGTGVVLFSAQSSLKPRYLEAVDPAIAAILGVAVVVGCSSTTRRSWRLDGTPARRLVTSMALVAMLAAPAAVSIAAVAGGAEDAGAPGALAGGRLTALADYARTHRHGARYALAAISVGAAASLVAQTGAPVRVLAANDARPLVSVPELRREITRGAVRTVLLGAPCAPLSTDLRTGCSPLATWVRAHGTDVSLAAGQAHAGTVYAVGRGARSAAVGRQERPRLRGRREPAAAADVVRPRPPMFGVVDALVYHRRRAAARRPAQLVDAGLRRAAHRGPAAAVEP